MIHRLLNSIIDIILPRQETVALANTITMANLHHLFAPRTHSGVCCLLSYKQPAVRALIHANKFYNHHHARNILAATLTKGLSLLLTPQPTILVPLPLGPKRERARGYNQVEAIIQATTLPTHVCCSKSLLTRPRDTREQSRLAKTERLGNVQNCFFANSAGLANLHHTHLIVIDDVMTSGATLHEAARTLRPHLPSTTTLTLLALAH